MRVLFDHQIFSYQRFGGISKYFFELYKEAKNINNIDLFLGMKESVNYYLNEFLPDNEGINKINGAENLFKKYLIYRRNRNYCIHLFSEKSYDILHSTFYDPYSLKYNIRPHVVTVHDMTPELYPQYYRGTPYSYMISRKWIKGKKDLVESANKVITVSENTKKDLIEVYGIPEKKVEVVYHGCNNLPNASHRLINNPYILYVGLRDKYKNFKFFVNAVKSILEKEKIKVLCVGGGKFSKDEERFLKENGLRDYFVQCYVDDAGLASAYSNALCFIFPSEYEGFGMPILEAFACGCPVILNKASCFPEIGGEAACYFDQQNPEQLTSIVQDLLTGRIRREELVAKGNERAKSFSWEKCIKETLKVYNEISF